MDLIQALENIKTITDTVAKEEINIIRQHKDEATPLLLAHVTQCLEELEAASHTDDWDEMLYSPFYEPYLLAEFKVCEALPLYLRMLQLHPDKCEFLLGDILTEDMPAMIAATAAENDLPQLKAIIENTEIEEFQRGAAMQALTTMYANDKLPREYVCEYLGFLLNNLSRDDELLTHIVGECMDVSATEHYPLIRQLYKAGCIDSDYVGVKELDEPDAQLPPEDVKQYLLERQSNTFIDDTITRVEKWSAFQNKHKSNNDWDNSNTPGVPIVKPEKPGRNDPCHCGSGNKYKRCCLHGDLG